MNVDCRMSNNEEKFGDMTVKTEISPNALTD